MVTASLATKIAKIVKNRQKFSKNAAPKGSPGFIRVFTGSIFQKLEKTGTKSLKSVLEIETSNKLHLEGKR